MRVARAQVHFPHLSAISLQAVYLSSAVSAVSQFFAALANTRILNARLAHFRPAPVSPFADKMLLLFLPFCAALLVEAFRRSAHVSVVAIARGIGCECLPGAWCGLLIAAVGWHRDCVARVIPAAGCLCYQRFFRELDMDLCYVSNAPQLYR